MSAPARQLRNTCRHGHDVRILGRTPDGHCIACRRIFGHKARPRNVVQIRHTVQTCSIVDCELCLDTLLDDFLLDEDSTPHHLCPNARRRASCQPCVSQWRTT